MRAVQHDMAPSERSDLMRPRYQTPERYDPRAANSARWAKPSPHPPRNRSAPCRAGPVRSHERSDQSSDEDVDVHGEPATATSGEDLVAPPALKPDCPPCAPGEADPDRDRAQARAPRRCDNPRSGA